MASSNACADCLEGTFQTIPRGVDSSVLWRQIVASSVGSATATLALNPINVIKVNLQKDASSSSDGSGSRSIRRVFGTIISENGVMGLWAGAPIGLLQSLPNAVLYMSVYESLKEVLSSSLSPDLHSSVSAGLAGGASRVVCVSLMSPLEVLRTIQTGGAKVPLAEIARRLYATYGVRGFYRGWSSTIARDTPFSALYWFGFDLLRPIWTRVLLGPSPSPSASGGDGAGAGATIKEGFSNAATFMSGASASMMAALLTHPFDVLKTQRQLSIDPAIIAGRGASRTMSTTAPVLELEVHLADSALAQATRLANSEATLTSLYRKSGVTGMYRGLSMRLATVIPASAIVITIYEYIKGHM